MKTSRQRQPTFLWQGLLIVLPVVALAFAGIISLRQDQALARHEAAEKAQALADEFATTLWSRLIDQKSLGRFKDHAFRIDARGQLLFPPAAAALPAPLPFDLAGLDPAQQRLWLALQSTGGDGNSRSAALAAGREFLGLNPPDSFAAAAQYRLGLLLEAEENLSEAASVWRRIPEEFPEAISESGTPLAPLARYKLLQLTARTNGVSAGGPASLDSFCSNLVLRPTFLTPHLLAKAAEMEPWLGTSNVVERWRNEWARHESLRALATAALTQMKLTPVAASAPALRAAGSGVPAVPPLFWFHTRDLSSNPQPIFLPTEGARSRESETSRQRRSALPLNLSDSRIPLDSVATALSTAPGSQPFDTAWLASRLDHDQGGYLILCRAMGSYFPDHMSVGSPAFTDLCESLPQLPAWFDFSLDIAGQTLVSGKQLKTIALIGGGGKGTGQKWGESLTGPAPEVLATAGHFEGGTQLLRVNIHLISPQMLFVRQRTRSYLFGFLIMASVVAALIGLVSARRAFVRQQQLSDMKSNFVSSVSHELRAPIASVRLLAESLERGRIGEPAKQNEYFRFIVQECRRLSSLIENVLDFARIEQGRKQYEFEPTDVVALVGKTVKLLEPVAAEKQVTLQLQLPEPGHSPFPEPVLDGSAIQQALVNLLDNAVKHAPAASTVTVGLDLHSSKDGGRPARSEPLNGSVILPSPGAAGEASENNTLPRQNEGGPFLSSLSLWVQDQGRGIPPEEHDRIFQRFYRPGSEMRRETQGVGIGLSIVKHIVQAHGGQVRVDSDVGKGSRFTIELPLKKMTT